MSGAVPIRIEARVDERERPGVIAAAEQLAQCLRQASGGQHEFTCELMFAAPGAGIREGARPAAVIASLLPELARADEPIAATAVRWRDYVERLQACGAPVYVRNIFRHVPQRARDGRSDELLERIRRLNRMALDLSRESGVAIVDLDRAFAHIGARELQCDFGLGGRIAAEMSGHTTVLCMLSFGMDDALDAQLQEQAKALHGSLSDVRPFLNRRLKEGPNHKRMQGPMPLSGS